MAPRARSGVASVLLLLLVLGSRASAQTLQIGIIDFYGLGRLSVADVRQTLTFKEGDSISFAGDARPAFLVEAEQRLAALPGVIRASVNPVCCDGGRVIVYVGLEQQGQAVTRFPRQPHRHGRACQRTFFRRRATWKTRKRRPSCAATSVKTIREGTR